MKKKNDKYYWEALSSDIVYSLSFWKDLQIFIFRQSLQHKPFSLFSSNMLERTVSVLDAKTTILKNNLSSLYRRG